MLLDEHIPSVICSGGTHHLVLQEPWLTARGILENSPGVSSICIPKPCLLQRTCDIEQVTNLPQSDVFICKMMKTAILKGLWGRLNQTRTGAVCRHRTGVPGQQLPPLTSREGLRPRLSRPIPPASQTLPLSTARSSALPS